MRSHGGGAKAGVKLLEMGDGALEERIEIFQLQNRLKGEWHHYSRWRDQCGHMQGNAAGVWSISGL